MNDFGLDRDDAPIVPLGEGYHGVNGRLGYLLRLAFQAMRGAIDAAARKHGLTAPQRQKRFSTSGRAKCAAESAPRAGSCDTTSDMKGLIDVHHHILPPAYVEAVGKDAIGELLVSGKAPDWSPEISLAAMDRNGIDRAYVSMSAPGVPLKEEAECAALVEAFNAFAAEMRGQSHGRFGTFSYLPLPHVAASLTEIVRAFDVLGTDGIGLLTSYGDKYLGDPDFFPVMEALNARRAVVFVHPDKGPCNSQPGLMPAATLDFPFDTTRCIASMLLSGVFQRYPDIRFIFSHAGGCVPFLAGRLARLERIPANAGLRDPGIIAQLSRQYFDTALSVNRYAFASLMEFADPQNILFGSDYPFAPEDTTTESIRALGSLGLSGEMHHAIARGNAERLFGCGHDHAEGTHDHDVAS